MKRLALFTIAISASLVLAGCGVPQTQPPPTVPVTPGYIRGYDHQLDFGFEYPVDWEDEVPQFESPYKMVEVFTKKGEPTQIEVSVRLTNLKTLAEVKGFGYIDEQSILKEDFVNINDRLAYEVVFKQYPDKKAKWVIFLANNREYRIECYTAEDLYAAREEIFDHVKNSFVIG